jgi:outer membrane murein-binding lipoprotein Lpp
MTTTPDELAARVGNLEEDVSRIRDLRLEVLLQAQAYGLSLVHADTQALRTDVTELRTDMTEVRTDVGELRTDMTEVRTDVAELKGLVSEILSLVRKEPQSPTS